ncbi:MAG: AAA family ATPase [Deltaproteobacteria bacterium]|nr:AAA family ATPase [Deltaproteobacteria bacterium]
MLIWRISVYNIYYQLEEITSKDSAKFIIVYGRRRVGKTELIEQFFKYQCVLKFEGIEIPKIDRRTYKQKQHYQINQCLNRLAYYLEDHSLTKVEVNTWTDFFHVLHQKAKITKKTVFYFEEVQWLSNYETDFFAELKPFWDDFWRHEKNLTLILCGSAPSFIVKQLLSDRALYGRVQEQFNLQPISLIEIKEYLKKGNKECMLAQLAVGGLIEYLKYLKGKNGNLLSQLCYNSFLPSSFFSVEQKKIFISSLSEHKYYNSIVEFLSKVKSATLQQISSAVKFSTQSGGSFTALLEDLEKCGFIEKYAPFHKDEQSKLSRYCIIDEYLQWYYKFIRPIQKEIDSGKFINNPIAAINKRSFETILGFSFERWCRKNAHIFAKILGFSGVDYKAGSYFNRNTEEHEKGFQIDLLYIIKGSKIIICEIKYYDGPIDLSVCDTIKKKVQLFQDAMPQYQNYTYETVLIATEGIKDHPKVQTTFDHIITFNEIFNDYYW